MSEKTITVSTIAKDADLSEFDSLLYTLPRTDPLFDLNTAKRRFQRLEIKADNERCGVVLFDVFSVGEKRVFYVGAMAVDALKAGGDVLQKIYDWLVNVAIEKKCDYFSFDSIRRGMLSYAKKNAWEVINIRYLKRLK